MCPHSGFESGCWSMLVHCCFQPLLKALFVLLDFGFLGAKRISILVKILVGGFLVLFLSYRIKKVEFS
jgi:hypothetical protein